MTTKPNIRHDRMPAGPELVGMGLDTLAAYQPEPHDWLLCAHGRGKNGPSTPAGFGDRLLVACDDVEDPQRGLSGDQAARVVQFIARAIEAKAQRILCVGVPPAPPGTVFARALSAAFGHQRRSWWVDQAVMDAYRRSFSS